MWREKLRHARDLKGRGPVSQEAPQEDPEGTLLSLLSSPLKEPNPQTGPPALLFLPTDRRENRGGTGPLPVPVT